MPFQENTTDSFYQIIGHEPESKLYFTSKYKTNSSPWTWNLSAEEKCVTVENKCLARVGGTLQTVGTGNAVLK